MVSIEIKDPELALQVLAALDAVEVQDKNCSDVMAHLWLDEVTWSIQAAIQKEEESVWKDLSSFDVDGYSAEINCLGEVRVEGKVFKPEFSKDFNEYQTTFPGPTGDFTISANYFVKSYFNKEL
jgi:hypothetical protein